MEQEIILVINSLNLDFLVNLCLVHFLMLSTHQSSDDTAKFYAINVAMDIGKKMIRQYLYTLKHNDIKYKDVSYSIWHKEMINKNVLVNIEEDEIIAKLGFRIIEILESCDMVELKLVRKSKEEQYYMLVL